MKASALDPITLEVIRSRLDGIADEMELTILKSSHSAIVQEGLRIPPLKLYDAGVPNETLLALIEANVRIPEIVAGDIRGQLAACEVGRRGVAALAERYGPATLRQALEELLDAAERMT